MISYLCDVLLLVEIFVCCLTDIKNKIIKNSVLCAIVITRAVFLCIFYCKNIGSINQILDFIVCFFLFLIVGTALYRVFYHYIGAGDIKLLVLSICLLPKYERLCYLLCVTVIILCLVVLRKRTLIFSPIIFIGFLLNKIIYLMH